MAVMMLIGTNKRVMGRLPLPPSLIVIGWIATGVMGLVTVAFFAL
jgi:hypothetical protein